MDLDVDEVARASSEETEALAKAKAKLAAHGLSLTPDKRNAQSRDQAETRLPIQADANSKAAKKAKLSKDSSQEEARKLLTSPPENKLDSRPKGAIDQHVEDGLQTLKTKPAFKGKLTQLKKHVTTLQELFKHGPSKQELTTAAVKFGLDENLAARLTIKNLSTVIAAAQFLAS